MLFLVSRTSQFGKRTIPPCDGAAPVYLHDEWDSTWEVEINSLDDLWKFVDKHGEIVLSRGSLAEIQAGSTRLHLEIYDDYRE